MDNNLCENASCRGSGVSITPQCFDGKKEFQVTIAYNIGSKPDTVSICKKCLESLKHNIKEAKSFQRSHGKFPAKDCKLTQYKYKLTITPIAP